MEKQTEAPRIDISALRGSNNELKEDVAKNIHDACRASGFFYACNHGIDLKALESVTNSFHQNISAEEKKRLAIKAYNPANSRSRSGFYLAIEGKKAPESFCYLNPLFTKFHPMIKDERPMHEVNVWPASTGDIDWRKFYENFYWSVFDLSRLLLRGFALSLGKEEEFFDPYFSSSNTLSAVSLIRYPYLEKYPPVKVGEDGVELNFENHQDVSLFTVLYQTPIPNLQVKTETGYLDVPNSDDSFLINCGTYMSHITNNYYAAPTHRVKFINAERLSIPFFAHFGFDSMIHPFTPKGHECILENKPLNYGMYLQHGLRNLIVTNGQT